MPGIYDFGPIYAETVVGRFPVEPYNTASNIIFLIICLYWARRTRCNYRRFPFIVIALPVLLIGFIGGTTFHATRSHPIWLYMDFIPIFVLAGSACYYLWRRITASSLIALLLMLSTILGLRLLRYLLLPPGKAYISIGYVLMALSIIIPSILHCFKNRWVHFEKLIAAFSSFAVAVLFRQLDTDVHREIFPMGTHFLWHLAGGISTFFLILYIYHDEKRISSDCH